jgi:hypothetical protein
VSGGAGSEFSARWEHDALRFGEDQKLSGNTPSRSKVFRHDRSHVLSPSRGKRIGVMNLLSPHGASQPGFQIPRHRPLPVEGYSRLYWPR